MILPVIRVDRRGKLVHPVQWKDLWFGVGGCGLDLATHAYSWITTKCHDYNNTWCGMSRLDITRLSRFGRLPLPRPTWGLQRLNTWTTRSRRSSCQGLKVAGLECVLQCTRSQDFLRKLMWKASPAVWSLRSADTNIQSTWSSLSAPYPGKWSKCLENVLKWNVEMRCGPCGFPDFEGALSLFPTRWSQERNSAFPPWSCDSASFLMVPLVRALRFTCLLHGSKLFNETFRTDVWTIDFLCFFQYVSALSGIYRDWDGTFSTHWTFWVLWGHLQKGMAWSGDPAYPPIVGGDEGFLHSILSPNSQFPFSIKDL